MNPKTCPRCSVTFTPEHKQAQVYCGAKCRVKAGYERSQRHVPADRLCRGCSKPFHAENFRTWYCSVACRKHTEYKRLPRYKGGLPDERRCSLCDEPFKPTKGNNRYCSSTCRSQSRNIWALYSIPPEQYRDMLLAQDHKCAICRLPCTTGRRLAVDHCHTTGRIRGLLCRACNQGLGQFKDDVALLNAAVAYLT
jgi:hypothetical protein